jgi:hypothetical protein
MPPPICTVQIAPTRLAPSPPWNGQIAEVYGRNSDPTLRGDSRSFVELDDFPRELLTAGYAVRINDEQGTSGKQIEAADRRHNRVVLQGVIGRLIAHESHVLAVLELSRLARDESGQDPAYLKKIIREHCNGRIITRRKTLNLDDNTESRHYDLECMMAGWRRQDDIEKAMDGYRRYIEDVVSGRREITMPHRLSFGYRRQAIADAYGTVQTLAKGKVRTNLALDQQFAETMRAFRRAANVLSDATRLARELNDARLAGPDRYRPVGQQWSRKAIRRLLAQDIYAGVWTPGRHFDSDEITTYLVRHGFNPAEQRRVEPGLAWFTQAELDKWRAKFSDKKNIIRTRKYDHPLLGLLACAECSQHLGTPVYLTRQGQQRISQSRGKENIYSCPERQRGRCTYGVAEGSALAALAYQIPAIQHRTADVVSRVAEWTAGGSAIRLQQAIRAKQDRRQWIDENLIQPCMTAGVKVDPKHVLEHDRLADEIDNLTCELDSSGAQTQALASAVDVLRALSGRLDQAIPMMSAPGQAITYSALLTVAYIGGTGKGRGKINSIAAFRPSPNRASTTQDGHNQG